MSDAVIISIISGIVAILSLGMTLLVNLRIARITASQKVLAESQDNLHRQINSRMDELLALTRKDSKAEGKAEEKADNESKSKII